MITSMCDSAELAQKAVEEKLKKQMEKAKQRAQHELIKQQKGLWTLSRASRNEFMMHKAVGLLRISFGVYRFVSY